MRQGDLVLESAWDFSTSRNGKLFTTAVPIAKNSDGSAITSLSTEEFAIDKDVTPAVQRLTIPQRALQVEGEPRSPQKLRGYARSGTGLRVGLRR